ncbi:hypothetical protein CJO75_12670 [Ralstonia solanacearum]|nr:hypothetical protein CJO75_12670 [Ralstonia solanacearum]
MRRPLALLTLTTSLLVAYVPPATALPSLGDLLYPTDSINDNISKLEGALRDLIEQFGNTVDAQTLKTMQRMLATLQSARLAYADVLNTTLEGIGEQRAALLYDVHNQLLELQKSLAGAGNTLSLTEQRVSSTLLSVSRAKRLPLLLEFDPPLYRPDLATPLQVTVRGQNLGHPENRLQFKGANIRPRKLSRTTPVSWSIVRRSSRIQMALCNSACAPIRRTSPSSAGCHGTALRNRSTSSCCCVR